MERKGGGTMHHLCFADPLVPDYVGGALLDHVGYGDPTQPFCYDPDDPDTWGLRTSQGIDAATEAQVLLDAEARAAGVDGGAAAGEDGQTEGEGQAEEDGHAGEEDRNDDTGLFADTDVADEPLLPGPGAASVPNVAFTDIVSGVDHGSTLHPPPDPDPAEGDGEGQTERATVTCPPFNMTDLLRQTVLQDDLYPVYRGWLAPIATYASGFGETNQRNQAAAKFYDVWLDRSPDCMVCHSTSFSKTDFTAFDPSHWDRFEPLLYDLEGTAFSYRPSMTSNKRFYGGHGGSTVHANVRSYFRTDVHTDTPGGGFNPWGFVDECVTRPGVTYDREGFLTNVPTDSGAMAAFAGQGRSGESSVLDLMEILRQGRLDQPSAYGLDPGWGASIGSTTTISCTVCHPAVNGIDLADTVPQMSNQKLYSVIRYGSGTMDPKASTSTEAWDKVRAVRDVYGSTPRDLMYSEPAAAVTLLATHVTDNIVHEVMGESLTLQHGFARNLEQRQALEELSAVFSAHWSLKDVLREVVLSEAFARHAPEVSTQEYTLPRLANPFSLQGPNDTAPAQLNNGVGDFVHRYSVSNLMLSVRAALGWPGPQLVGNGTVFPIQTDMGDVGRYESTSRPGNHMVDLANLVAWEDLAGTCDKPDKVVASQVQLDPNASPPTSPYTSSSGQWLDWIDVAIDQGAGSATIEQMVVALKDRVLGDPVLEPAEALLIEDLFAGHSLNGTFKAHHEDELRSVCGALLKSPQFMLGGLEHSDPVPVDPPDFLPCMDGDDCTYDDLCERYDGILALQGYTYNCPGGLSGGGIDDPI